MQKIVTLQLKGRSYSKKFFFTRSGVSNLAIKFASYSRPLLSSVVYACTREMPVQESWETSGKSEAVLGERKLHPAETQVRCPQSCVGSDQLQLSSSPTPHVFSFLNMHRHKVLCCTQLGRVLVCLSLFPCSSVDLTRTI